MPSTGPTIQAFKGPALFARRLLVALVLLGGGAVIAQSALAQVGVTEADARNYLDRVLNGGGPHFNNTYDSFAVQLREAWKKLPASARGPVMTGIYAWAKANVSTPAFRAAYLKTRTEQKPVPSEHVGTVEEELKAKLAEETAAQEAGFKMLESKGQKAAADRARKQWVDMQKQLATVYRTEITDKRANDKADYDKATNDWSDRFPPDANGFIAKHLREFLAATPDVDFAAKQKLVHGEAGDVMVFVNEAYAKKPWQWQEAYNYGPEAIAAARTAAAAWLKELGK